MIVIFTILRAASRSSLIPPSDLCHNLSNRDSALSTVSILEQMRAQFEGGREGGREGGCGGN